MDSRLMTMLGYWAVGWLALVVVLTAVCAGQPCQSPHLTTTVTPTWGHSLPVTDRQPPLQSRPLNCSDTRRLVALRVKPHVNDRQRATVGVYLCPAVRVLRLQLLADSERFIHVPGKASVTSCSRANDTVIVRKGCHRYHVALSIGESASRHGWLNYSYNVHDRCGLLAQQIPASARRLSDDKSGRPSLHTSFRFRRSAQGSNPTPTPAPPVVNDSSDVQKDITALGSTRECGVTKTCIRYGRKGCGHLSCDYMVSYTANSTHVDLELSARDAGWVAIGFSSDKFMGGGDDVIACKRDRPLSPRVVSLSMENAVKHNRPQEKRNRLTLTQSLVRDKDIYCRVTRLLKFPERLADSDLDLVNDWHQLYAFGDIDGRGRLLQHTEIPRVSEKKITMVRLQNILLPTSMASLPVSAAGLGSLLLPLSLALTFTGS